MVNKKIIFAGIVALLLTAYGGGSVWLNLQKQRPFTMNAQQQQKRQFYQQPNVWFRQHLDAPALNVDGQILHPKLQYMLQQRKESPYKHQILNIVFSIPLGRKLIRTLGDDDWLLLGKETAPMDKITDLRVQGRAGQIPIRIYQPELNTKQPLPVLIYAHGGGYIFGSVKGSDRVAQLLANEAKMLVISIDYRLAPEDTYPAASDDGEDVFLWAKQHIQRFGGDAQKIAFGGDSAGAHIAINVAQRQIAKHQPTPNMLLLYYPAVGLPFHDASYRLFAKGYGLDAEFFEYLLSQAFPEHSLKNLDETNHAIDGYMAPIQAKNLQNMPPSIVVTAGYDILRDSGQRFAQHLKQQGVTVWYYSYAGLIHNFLQLSGVVDEAEQAATETAQQLGHQMRLKQVTHKLSNIEMTP